MRERGGGKLKIAKKLKKSGVEGNMAMEPLTPKGDCKVGKKKSVYRAGRRLPSWWKKLVLLRYTKAKNKASQGL